MNELPPVTDITDLDAEPPAPGRIRWFGLVLLLGHLALVVIGAVALWRIAGGWWVGALAAGVFALAYLLLWQLLLAPGSARRLGHKERQTVNLIAGPLVVVVASLAGLWLVALVALSVVVLGDSLDERSRRA